jgi:hypothetical protein
VEELGGGGWPESPDASGSTSSEVAGGKISAPRHPRGLAAVDL